MNPGSFSGGIRNHKLRFVKRHQDLKRAVGIKLFGAIIQDSPVDTGRLRANWQASVNEPDRSTSSSPDPSGGAAIAKIVSTALAVNDYDAFTFTNSLPYAYRIEYLGWSHTKAPQGMVLRNVLRFKLILKEQLDILK